MSLSHYTKYMYVYHSATNFQTILVHHLLEITNMQTSPAYSEKTPRTVPLAAIWLETTMP